MLRSAVQAPTRGDVPAAVFAAARAGDAAARRAATERYLPLARSLALRFHNRGEPLEDLVQVASLGLVRAIDRFDPERGLAFSSFAVPTILGELRRHFRDRTWGVHMPRQLQERAARVTKAADVLAAKLARQPTVAEICTATGDDEEAVLEALQAARAYRSTSLDRPIGDDDDDPFAGVLGYDDDAFADVEARFTVEAAARCLTARQRAVLWLHVDEDLTQDEIAARIGISQMQVSRDLAAVRSTLRTSLGVATPAAAA